MPNHFHLVVGTPQGNLVAGMQWLLGTYTCRFDRRHKLFGRLFRGRYEALVVDGSGDGYLKAVCDCVHLNPARVRLLAADEPFGQELLAQVDRQLGAVHFGAERAASQEERAERLVQTALDRLGRKEGDLAARRKGDPAKMRLAQRLRVSFLQPDDVRPLLTRPIPEFDLTYAPGAVEAAIAATRCQPFLVQAVSGAMKWLREHDVLDEAGKFAVPMVERWVRENAG